MSEVYDKLIRCLKSVRERTDFVPKVALVLGSGLGDYADTIEVKGEIDYHSIEGFPVSTAPGHAGKFIYGYVGEVPVICMKGRVHYYEGYPMQDVVLPIRLMKLMGAEIFFVTNASGGIRYEFNVGDLMLMTGHISNFVPNPLIGPNIEELGTRFPDMTKVYDEDLQQVIRESAQKLGIKLVEGTYVQTTGPSYESPQEIEMFRTLGADAVGMSTVCEVIAARHMGMRICGISAICNKASGLNDAPLGEQDIIDTGKMIAEKFTKLVTEAILHM